MLCRFLTSCVGKIDGDKRTWQIVYRVYRAGSVRRGGFMGNERQIEKEVSNDSSTV
ncbi:hypothetical protein F320042A7_33740 [Blautia producta]